MEFSATLSALQCVVYIVRQGREWPIPNNLIVYTESERSRKTTLKSKLMVGYEVVNFQSCWILSVSVGILL